MKLWPFSSLSRTNLFRYRICTLFLARPTCALACLRTPRPPFRRAIERDDDNSEAHDGLGIALRRRGLYEDAVYEHTRAATLFHDRPQTHMNLGIALAMSEQFDWAIRAFSVAAELAPENPLPHRWLTKLYRRVKKDDDKAREHARAWAQLRKRFFEKTGR